MTWVRSDIDDIPELIGLAKPGCWCLGIARDRHGTLHSGRLTVLRCSILSEDTYRIALSWQGHEGSIGHIVTYVDQIQHRAGNGVTLWRWPPGIILADAPQIRDNFSEFNNTRFSLECKIMAKNLIESADIQVCMQQIHAEILRRMLSEQKTKYPAEG